MKMNNSPIFRLFAFGNRMQAAPFRLFRILSALLLLSISLGACSGTDNQAGKTPLRVGWSLWPGYYPMAIAAEKGFFAKHGVQVEPVFYTTYSNQPPDLASGMIDGALVILGDTLFDPISSDIKVVLVLDNSTGADQVVASSSIAGPADLRGKRIGVLQSNIGGILLIQQMLRANNVSAADVTFVHVSPERVPDAIPSLIDAGYTFEPFSSDARAKGAQIIFTSAEAPGTIVDVLAFRKEIVQNRPEDVRAFIAAWFEALEYWQANPADGNAIIARATGLSPDEVSAEGATLFDLASNQQAFTQGTDATSVYVSAETALRFVISSGDVTTPVDINDLIDPSFVK